MFPKLNSGAHPLAGDPKEEENVLN